MEVDSSVVNSSVKVVCSFVVESLVVVIGLFVVTFGFSVVVVVVIGFFDVLNVGLGFVIETVGFSVVVVVVVMGLFVVFSVGFVVESVLLDFVVDSVNKFRKTHSIIKINS